MNKMIFLLPLSKLYHVKILFLLRFKMSPSRIPSDAVDEQFQHDYSVKQRFQELATHNALCHGAHEK